ncbi:hypothetical protein [Candidatus Palauibacter sp.]|uniref:hypothetical protein n=1 Tax=Candidatus Palauibacter sp. TaxID=3101350 RepID=UPI003AF23B54
MNPTALTLLAIALGLVFDPTRVEAQSRPPQEEPLWVGVLDRDGNLVPVARYKAAQPGTGAGAWDEPWPELFEFEALRFDRQTGTPLFVDLPRWLPNQETRSGWRRTKAAPVRWYVHSPGEPVTPVDATFLTITHAHCVMAWRLDVEETPEVSALLRRSDERRQQLVGPVFSRPAAAVVDEVDIPALDRIRQDLDLVDRPAKGDVRLDHRWLGFYHFSDLLLGVMHVRGYEGESYVVVEIDGDQGRIAARVHGGGC